VGPHYKISDVTVVETAQSKGINLAISTNRWSILHQVATELSSPTGTSVPSVTQSSGSRGTDTQEGLGLAISIASGNLSAKATKGGSSGAESYPTDVLSASVMEALPDNVKTALSRWNSAKCSAQFPDVSCWVS
jgi:hypothetical protein